MMEWSTGSVSAGEGGSTSSHLIFRARASLSEFGNRCEFDLLFYNSQSQANWSRKNGRALPAVRGEISNTEI